MRIALEKRFSDGIFAVDLDATYGEQEKAQKKGLTGDALLGHRRARIRPIADKFERWLAEVKPTLRPSEPLTVAVRYYARQSEALFTLPRRP